MRQKLLASAAFIVLGAALAVPAAAHITVHGTVDYDKAVTETETLNKIKTVTITVGVAITGSTAVETNSIVNQRIGPYSDGETTTGANVSTYTSGDDAVRLGVDFFANMDGSILANVGITQVNQDVGTGSNQQNVLTAAVGGQGFFAEANNAAAQYVTGETVSESGRRIIVDGHTVGVQPIREAAISGSVNRNTGVVQVNQNAGVFNNQVNSAAVALGLIPGQVALAESDLGQWNTGNVTTERNDTRIASAATSVNNNTGVVMGNQAAGYMANQANMVSLSASLGAPSVNAGFTTFAGSITPNF
jgi:hypothetical protein